MFQIIFFKNNQIFKIILDIVLLKKIKSIIIKPHYFSFTNKNIYKTHFY